MTKQHFRDSRMKPLNISMRAKDGIRPRSYSNNEEEWRKKIKKHVEDKKKKKGVSFSNNEHYEFDINLKFHMTKGRRYNSNDVENLAKPVIDALFMSPHSTSKHQGGLCNCDDGCVIKLNISKKPCKEESEEGVDISIKWKEVN